MTSRNSSDTCPYCGRKYRTFEIKPLFGGKPHYQYVDCDCEGAMAERNAEDRSRRSSQLHTAWTGTGVPTRFLGVTPDYKSLPKLDNGNGLYLYGNRGTGKTRHACEILKAYVARNTSESGWCNARFVSVAQWLDDIRDTYGRWGASSGNVFHKAAGADLLVLDDFGKVDTDNPTWAVAKMFLLIDKRYEDMKPTIFTSRFNLKELVVRLTVGSEATAGDMASRIAETCEFVKYDGEDRRLENAVRA